jgi:adenylate cyclase
MTTPLEIHVYEMRWLAFFTECEGPVVLGRQQKGEQGPYRKEQASDHTRLVIAEASEQDVSRHHVLLEPLPGGKVRVSNRSKRQSLPFPDLPLTLAPQASWETTLPFVLRLGANRTVRVQEPADEGTLESLAQATAPPGSPPPSAEDLRTLPFVGGHDLRAHDLITWLRSITDVLQSATSSVEFFDKAALAVTTIANLDSGRILLLENGEWRTRVLQLAARARNTPERRASRNVLQMVQREKRTCWKGMPAVVLGESIKAVDAVVAAPILDRRGEVIGALYGDRWLGRGAGSPITELEAMLVELLARGVAAGLARLEQEQAALAARVRFEEFFSRELSEQLALHPEMLKPRETEVTVLFCDVRGFSTFSEQLGPTDTFEWISSVMEELSNCIRAEAGVLVDYIGDELIAMWGTPGEQPDHAPRACRAALEMLRCLPALNERWAVTLGDSFSLGIGINTGKALVGNAGTRHKFKYGPLGGTVNLASRVQGATRHLKCSLLITQATRAKIDDTFVSRRLARVKVHNIDGPVEVHELASDTPAWREAVTDYEKALGLFEACDFSATLALLGGRQKRHEEDGPALVLLKRAVDCQWKGAAPPDHPVWELPTK